MLAGLLFLSFGLFVIDENSLRILDLSSRACMLDYVHQKALSQDPKNVGRMPCHPQESRSSKHMHPNSSMESLIGHFFISPADERNCLFPGSTSPGFPQPITAFGRLMTIETVMKASLSSQVLCFHLTGDKGECGPALRYTRIKDGRMSSCRDVYDVPTRPGCRAGFEGHAPILNFEGPTFVFSRTPHFPHFLEEVASGANWLAQNNLSYFSHALIDETGGTCQTHASYKSGSWAPAGFPLNRTLQVAMMRTIARGVIFSWGLRKNRSVCLGEPYRKWQTQTPDLCTSSGCHIQYFDNPTICATYRHRMMQHFGISERSYGRHHVLILQRFSGGRIITNLGDLIELDSFKQLELNVTYTSLEGMDAETQVREFSNADILIAHHGAAIALSSLLRPGGLVIEIFNYNVKCDFFDYLYKSCGLKWERLVNLNGVMHLPYLGCNGNNRKDNSENAAVDLMAIYDKIQAHVRATETIAL